MFFALFFLGKQYILKIPFISGKEKTGLKSASGYHALDPIITNLGGNRQIKISLMIRYHPELKEHITGIEPIARDSILAFLTSPDIKKIATESNLATLKSYIDNEITNMLKNDYNNDILLKELVVY